MLLVVKWISVDGQEVSASDFWNRPGMHPDFRSCCDVSIVRSTTDRRWVQFEWHQLAFVSSVVCDKSNCDLRGGDTLTVELRRVLSGVLREPGKSDACMCKSRFIDCTSVSVAQNHLEYSSTKILCERILTM